MSAQQVKNKDVYPFYKTSHSTIRSTNSLAWLGWKRRKELYFPSSIDRV